MELQTISQVSKRFGISTRTLRYYEQIGLIEPAKKEDFAYRMYSQDAILRLRQIIVLRKLRIPLKQIADILQSGDGTAAIEAFERSLSEIEDELTALSVIRDVTKAFLTRLNFENTWMALLDDGSLLEAIDALTVSKINIKEEKTMEELNQATEKLNKLTDRQVRIVYLPPATVAASHYIGNEPEHHAWQEINKFVEGSKLLHVKPDTRNYGFNHPNPGMREDGKYGYEIWVTIPEDMDVPAPLQKKHFEGGLYAAYMILVDEIDGIGWTRLWDEWFKGNDTWEGNMSPSGENMYGLLEEKLNNLNPLGVYTDPPQFDLLMPIKKK